MLVIRRSALALVATCVGAMLAACGGADDASDPALNGPLIEATTMRGALLQTADIGPTWTAPQQSPEPGRLVRFCAGEAPVPPVPAGPTVVASALVDEGAQGAQTLDQIALVYADPAGAAAGLAALRAVADACPPTVSMPAKDTTERREPAYTETVATSPLAEAGWSGFVLVRHKQYDPKKPSTADTAVAVLAKRNVVLVDAYAVYRLGATSTGPQFTADWQKLVGTVVNRVAS